MAGEVEGAADDLVRAIERLNLVLDAAGDDSELFQHVPFRLPMELERLALRISTGQGLRNYD